MSPSSGHLTVDEREKESIETERREGGMEGGGGGEREDVQSKKKAK